MAANPFQKIVDSTNRAITKISVKTSSSLEKNKIKMHIDNLNRDIQNLYGTIGAKMYALWIKGESADQDVINRLEAIKQKNEEIKQLTIEMNAIDARDNEILGTRQEYAAPQQSAPVQQPVPVQPGAVQVAAQFNPAPQQVASQFEPAPVQVAAQFDPAPVQVVAQVNPAPIPEAPAQPVQAALSACPNCGEPQNGTAKFCRKCGYNLQG